MSKAQEARQDAAIVLLLQALPEDRLEAILGEVAPRRRELLAPSRDNRYCTICGRRYRLCRELYATDHEFKAPERAHAPEEGS